MPVLPSSNPEAAGAGASGLGQSNGDRPLPKGHTAMIDILDGKVYPGRFVRVIGLVKDSQLPIQSNGTDYKMTIKLYDKSLEAEYRYLAIHIFTRKEKMPSVGPGDVVLLQAAKVQHWRGESSLITNFQTAVHVFTAAKIPRPPDSAMCAWIPSKTNERHSDPTLQESEFVSWLYHSVDKELVPTVIEFQAKTMQSLNVMDKFSSLKDVASDQFRNLIVMVVGNPYGNGESVSIWVTDFSENQGFNDFPRPGMAVRNGMQAGDQFGYITKYTGPSRKTLDNWTGPYGKLSMRITCYEPHASFIRSHVKAGSWVELENVYIKMGQNGAALEGFLREDIAYGSPLRVSLVEWSSDEPERIDPRLKDAVRRKRDYERQNKSLLKKKRKQGSVDRLGNGSNADKAKMRRKRARLLKNGAENADQEPKTKGKVPARNQLNTYIISDHNNQGLTQLSSVLEPVYHDMPLDDGKKTVRVQLPFVNSRFRAQVRVVDFMPAHLEDFAVGRRPTEYDMLSDNGDEANADHSSSSEEEQGPAGTLDSLAGERVWEWRFALLLEDATPLTPTSTQTSDGPQKAERARIWATVDNSEAQMLVGLDACELRKNEDVLGMLREKMFILWGDLAEKKMQALQAERQARKKAAQAAAALQKQKQKQEQERREQQEREDAERKKETERLARAARAKDQAATNLRAYPAPPDSDDDEPSDQSRGQAGVGSQTASSTAAATALPSATAPLSATAQPAATAQPSAAAQSVTSQIMQKVKNKPFVCCLQQYGVRVWPPTASNKHQESDEDDDDDEAAPRRQWQRMFGLFGTQIVDTA